MRSASLIGLLIFGLTLSSKAARASISLAADVNTGVSLASEGSGFGHGIDGRIGKRFDLLILKLTPEVGAGYFQLPSGDSMIRGFAGGRIALGLLLEPFVFTHIGYGRPGVDEQALGFWDVGGGLDLSLIPLLTMGLHVSYHQTTTGSRVWLLGGLHAAFTF